MLHIADLTTPSVSVIEAIPAVLEVVECLLELILSVQHKGPVMCDGLGNRFTGEQDEPCVRGGRFYQDILLIALVWLEHDCLWSILRGKALHLQGALIENDH